MSSISFINKILLCFCFLTFTIGQAIAQQRPWPIEKVRPVIDSVKMEADRLYHLLTIKNKSFELYFNQPTTNDYKIKHLILQDNDTNCVLLINDNQLVVACYCFKGANSDPFSSKKESRNLSENEQLFFQAKSEAILEAQKAKYEIQSHEECAVEFIFHPNSNGYTLYALSVPLVDSILPWGNDLLFLFDFELKLLSWNKYHKFHMYNIRAKDNPPNSTLYMIFSPVIKNVNDFKPIIPYIAKFHLYHHNLRLTEFFLSINKRKMKYDALNNEIAIELFPIEKE
tara:strand:+ start:1408 stop:2259 length:852 start_codon:yes stop_codon:yes gene_type:complete